jgi:hypothetical protein
MDFIKWYVNKYGLMLGGGSLLIVALSFIGLAVVTKGIILILIPLAVFWFVVVEFIGYSVDKDYDR